jgi:hypothetical protein
MFVNILTKTGYDASVFQRRRDYQQKLSTQNIRENRIVCIESLQVKNASSE